jgi:adenylyl cyclase-associated protein
VELSKKIAPEVGQQAELVLKAVEAQKQFIAVAASSKKPADVNPLVKPTSDLLGEVIAIRDKSRTSKFFNNLSAVSEGIPALGWVLVEKTPGPHVADMRGGSEFYSNRILKDFKGKDETQVSWVSHFNTFLKDLQTYIKNFHTTGVAWNPKGGEAKLGAAPAAAAPSAPKPPPAGPPPPAAPPAGAASASKAPDTGALFAALNKGGDVTSGLKKVTDDMKTKNRTDKTAVVAASAAPAKAEKPAAGAKQAAKKPPKFQLDGNKWVVENQENNREIVISETEPKQVVYIYGCLNTTVQIKSKVNAITVDNCKRTAVVFENAVSGLEIVNSNSLEIQIIGKVPSVAIDKSSGVQLFLSKDCLDAEIVTSKSDSMNILIPTKEGADPIEIPVPEQYKSIIKDGKLITECVQHSG